MSNETIEDLQREVLRLQLRNKELEERTHTAEETTRQAKKVFEGNLAELQRAGEKAAEILSGLSEEYQKADILRNRLSKVTDALARADEYVLALEAGSGNLEERKKAYSASKLVLATPDDHLHGQAPAQR